MNMTENEKRIVDSFMAGAKNWENEIVRLEKENERLEEDNENVVRKYKQLKDLVKVMFETMKLERDCSDEIDWFEENQKMIVDS